MDTAAGAAASGSALRSAPRSVVAAASHRYVEPVYVDGECCYIERYNLWGRPRLIKVCEDD